MLLSVCGFYSFLFFYLAGLLNIFLYFSACSWSCLSKVLTFFSTCLACVVLSWLMFPIKVSLRRPFELSYGIASLTTILRLQSRKSNLGTSSQGYSASLAKTTTLSLLSTFLSCSCLWWIDVWRRYCFLPIADGVLNFRLVAYKLTFRASTKPFSVTKFCLLLSI